MIGTVKEVNVNLVMAALSALVTQETDGDEDKQERLRRCRRLVMSISTEPVLGISVHDVQDEGTATLFKLTDDDPKWQTWANELGLRMQPDHSPDGS